MPEAIRRHRMPPHEIKDHLSHLALQTIADSERWFGDIQDGELIRDVRFLTLGMCGEAGEFANVVKKVMRGDLKLDDPRTHIMLAGELTDTFIYLLELAGVMAIDLEKTYELIRGQNEKRFMEARAERERRAAAEHY